MYTFLKIHLVFPLQSPPQPGAQPTNRRIGGKSYKTETDNTRKNKFCSNKTSTYSARNGGLSPLHS